MPVEAARLEMAGCSWLGRRRCQQWLDNGPEFIRYDLLSHTENLGMAVAAFKVLKGILKRLRGPSFNKETSSKTALSLDQHRHQALEQQHSSCL